MRVLTCLALVAIISAAIEAQQPQPAAENPSDQQPVPVMMHDGGVTQVLQSIYIPPIQNAAFTAIVHTEWVRPLPEAGTFTVTNQRQVARDSQGRIYEERWLLVPKGGKVQSQMNVIQIGDPVAHTLYNCYLLRKPHVCTLERFAEGLTTSYRPASGQSGPLPDGSGFRTHEDLGIANIAGVETAGTRNTITYNEGVIGNDKPFNVTREFWFAASLGIDLRSEVTNPSFGKQVFTVSDVNMAEPDPKLFQIPDGFEVVDKRKPTLPQPQ